jgi:2-keto-3-deoxy-L-arabinonate dehydratase
MTTSTVRPYKGVFPVVPTVFDADGRLDLEGQKRAVDCMIPSPRS